jgi:hypothetical protein
MKCYVVFFSECRHEAPLLQKVFLSKKEADDYVEFKNWQCHERYKKLWGEKGIEYFEEDVQEVMWVEDRELC